MAVQGLIFMKRIFAGFAVVALLLAGILSVLLLNRSDRIYKEQAVAKSLRVAEDSQKRDELLHKIDLEENAGLITPAKAQELRDVLNGKTHLYVAPDGILTTNSTFQK